MDIKNLFTKELFAEEFACVCCSEERLENKHNYLCDKCFNDIKFIKNACSICGDEVSPFDLICQNCVGNDFYFDKIMCCAKYDGTAKKMIHQLKYFGKKYIAESIASFMAEKLEKSKIEKIDKIICVPLNRERILERGFNQSEILARKIAEKCNLTFCLNLAIRIKDTPTQTALSKEERNKNMKGAFFIPDNVNLKGENILVIDDVFTTGATINELSKMLKEKGANKIYGLTFCHA